MKKIGNYIKKIILLPIIIITFTVSCEDYLAKMDEADINQKDIFSTYRGYQGWVDEIYRSVFNYHTFNWKASWNWGDDVYTTNIDNMTTQIQKGNYWELLGGGDRYPFFYDGWDPITITVWTDGWEAIRKCNIGLKNLDLLVDATDEEKRFIEGQLLFLRAWYHFEFMGFFGGLPYVDELKGPDDDLNIPRLNYQQTADKVAADLLRAGELLPVDWDMTEAGSPTKGDKNEILATKVAAYGVLAKNYLYAASPLMNGESGGGYIYNKEYCEKAASACDSVFKYASQGTHPIQLASWDNYKKLFFREDNRVPGMDEKVFGCPDNDSWWHAYTTKQLALNRVSDGSQFEAPTANFVDLFETANGLPIDEDPDFNPANPWDKRDPRFYINIVKDGDQISVTKPEQGTNKAELFIGGLDRDSKGSATGFGIGKWSSVRWNRYDSWAPGATWSRSRIRLSDIYLIYAEAANEAFGPNNAGGGTMTAVQAINVIRERAQMPPVNAKFTGSTESFRKRIWNERSVELAFEGQRWYDIRRWYVAHENEYKELKELKFDKDHTYFNESVVYTRVHDMKHYWLPFPKEQVAIYPEWYQNPGW